MQIFDGWRSNVTRSSFTQIRKKLLRGITDFNLFIEETDTLNRL